MEEAIESILEQKILEIKSKEHDDDKFPEGFLTPEDVRTLIDASEKVRDKAIISLLWETGARLSEIYDLKVGSFQDWEEGKKVTINGFTGERELPLIDSASLLTNWLSEHPKNDDPNHPLWCWTSQEEGKTGGKVTYNYIRKMIQNAAEEIGNENLISVNLFRKSRTAFLAQELNDEEMNQWFGWKGDKDLSGLRQNCSDCSGCPFSCSVKGRL